METFSRVRPGLGLANPTERKRSKYNSKLWNSGIEDDKEIARNQKRKLSYIANVYIVKDPQNPENEGRVALFRFGKKIFDKIKDKMEPEFEDEEPQNPFDFWEGSNFRLKIRNVSGFRNYDKSEFDNPSPLFDDDAEIEKVWKQEHYLSEFVDESAFKSYDELKKRLDFVMGFDTDSSQLMRPGDVPENTPQRHETAEQKIQENLYSSEEPNKTPQLEPQVKNSSVSDTDGTDGDEEEDDYFADLANKL